MRLFGTVCLVCASVLLAICARASDGEDLCFDESFAARGSVPVTATWNDTTAYSFLYEFGPTNAEKRYYDSSTNHYDATNTPTTAYYEYYRTSVGGYTNQYGRVEHYLQSIAGTDNDYGLVSWPTNWFVATNATIGWWKYNSVQMQGNGYVYNGAAGTIKFYSQGEYPWGTSLYYYQQDDTAKGMSSSPNPAPLGLWTFYVITYGGGQARMFTNLYQCDSEACANLKSGSDIGPLWIAEADKNNAIDFLFGLEWDLSTNMTLMTNMYLNTHPTNNLRIR